MHSFAATLVKNGTCFFGSSDPVLPLGLALRTPTYLTTKLCIDLLLKTGCVTLTTEMDGKRVLIRGEPKLFEVSEGLQERIDALGAD